MANGMFKDERSFYEWLTDSNAGRIIDQKRAGVVSKKCRVRSGRAAAESKSNLDADNRLQHLLQISNKHYCRIVNDRFLRELAPPLDAEEIAGLFAPPPWGERDALTPLEQITGAGDNAHQDMAAWEPFRNNVDMDKEAHVLESSLKSRSKEAKSNFSQSMVAMKAWQRLERRAREALRRNYQSPLLEAFEKRISNYLKSAEESEILTLEVENPFHRLLLHGVCEFYDLACNTLSKWEDTAEGCRLLTTIIIKKKQHSESSTSAELVQMGLVEFLSELKNRGQKLEAAA